MNRAKRFAIITIIIASIFCLEPIYLLGKAVLAQQLLNYAWNRTKQHPNQTNKPWQWADTSPIAKLTLLGQHNMQQSQNNDPLASWIILSGMTGRTMAFGPGWLQDSAKPNQFGNTVISAHNDSHFDILEKVNIGDILALEDKHGITLDYRINNIRIVSENDNSAYQFNENRMLTLITCYPFTLSNTLKTKRLIVTAMAQ